MCTRELDELDAYGIQICDARYVLSYKPDL